MVYRYLQLETFDGNELERAFDRILAAKAGDDHDTTAKIPTLEQDFAAAETTTTETEVVQFTTEPTTIPKLDVLTEESIRNFFVQRIQDFEAERRQQQQVQGDSHVDAQRQEYATQEARQFLKLFDTPSSSSTSIITKCQFRDTITSMAESVDYRKTLPVTISMLLVGTSVGIISPVMPFVVEEMGLSAGQYGWVVSAFALAKIVANVPSAVLVERHGRKPYMVHSLSLIALGTGGIGIATNFEQLYLCRLCVGLGVAALSSASTLSIADISNPKNRAQTMAPIMSAFAAGTALGPAMGGILADELGIHETFHVVGGCFLAMTVVNQMLLSETQPQLMRYPWQQQQDGSKKQRDNSSTETTSMVAATKKALGQWSPLLKHQEIRNVVVINGFYWVALAGAQMTLLPLLLTDPQGLAMTATGVGQVYMGMSLVQVLGNPIVAKFVDGFGKVPAMIGGCSLIATGMATLPLAEDLTSVALTLGIWSTGSTLLSTAPVAYISDVTENETRAQAIALLRTSGDVGFLVGASAVGALADWAGNMDVAMQSSAGLLLTATAWFGARQYLNIATTAAAQQSKSKQ